MTPKANKRASSGALAQQMPRCIDDPDLLRCLGRVGREGWCETYKWAAIAARYEAVLMGQVGAVVPRKLPRDE